MHNEIAEVSLATIKARIAEGDCPMIKPYSVEILEELVVHFADLVTPPQEPSEQKAVAWREFDHTTIDYVLQYGGRCRACADHTGLCPNGLPCDVDDAKTAIRWVLKALNYGISNGYLASPPPSGDRGSVKVKTLTWEKQNVDGTLWCSEASVAGMYRVKCVGDDWMTTRNDLIIGRSNDASSAFALAQSDCEQRIRSAIVSAPHPVAPAEGEIERFSTDVINWHFHGANLISSTDGIWVRYADHAIALTALSAKMAEVERDNATLREDGLYVGKVRQRAETAERKLDEARKALEPFGILAEASDRLAVDGQRRLQPEAAAALGEAEIAALVMPDDQVMMTDGRMAFGHDQHPSKPARITMGDLRRARALTTEGADHD
jgi:hypothetical protein